MISDNSEPSNLSNLVTVMGFDRKDILFSSKQATVIQVRDSAGEIVALFVRLRNDVFGYSRKGDRDWEENLKIYGNPDC